jgi:glycine/D-amino acid oxidase-like deaminating enzyme
MRVAICGGGVIGASIAYFLARRGVAATVIEGTGIACAASGKSGGFLARDWCDGSPLAPLAHRSFDLHAQLADEMPGDWGYRRLDTYGGFAGFSSRGGSYELSWLSGDVSMAQALGSPETTAQVHPGQFTAAMMRAAEALGAELRLGRVIGLVRRDNPARITGVEVDGSDIVEADAVVIAMGPWSILAAQWLPLPAVFGLKGHSLVFETGTQIPAEAAFLECREPDTGAVLTPELFPRTDGTTYVCGISGEEALPIDPSRVTPDGGALYRLEAMCRTISPVLGAAKILVRQAYYRPITRDGLPLIGAVSGVADAYVATGHSVWGILNAPATGEAMAELILDGTARTVDLTPFKPSRLPALNPTRLQR